MSGEPDNKLALMSLGLSLMQNRAGKDFNLSNIIGAAGEAGQKALPLFKKLEKRLELVKLLLVNSLLVRQKLIL